MVKDSLETLAPDSPNWLALPNLCMMRFHAVYCFDHDERTVTRWSDSPSAEIITPVEGKVLGDIDRQSVEAVAGWLTPVPGGVGPMTVAMLLRNTVMLARARNVLEAV